MTFEEIWPITENIPGSFTRLNAEKLYEYASQVPEQGCIVEIGVDQGRSASILLATALKTHAAVVLVDSWPGILIDNKFKVERLVDQFDSSAVIVHGTSSGSSTIVTVPIDLIHIDAHHGDASGVCDEGSGPFVDCEKWLPKLRSGGVVCFHDYHATFPAVTAAVDQYTAGWEDLGEWESLAIRRKP